jgi:hypothetical protein
VDVEVMVDVDAEEAADVFEGVEDAATLDVPVFGSPTTNPTGQPMPSPGW